MPGTLAAFTAAHKIKMTAERVDANPQMADSDNMDHWKVVLQSPRRRMSTYFSSKGYGHNGKEPKAAEVLDCLASDAASYENVGSFEEWAREFGYYTDCRRAEKTFKAVEHGARRLKAFLGDDAYQWLLFDCERE